jgi:TrmH family RNA methyltransferase
MNRRIITSSHNIRVKDTVRLRTARQRKKQSHFVIDGVREVARAIEGGVRLIDVFVCEALCHGEECRQLLDMLERSGAALWDVPPEVFEKLAFGQRAEGVVAVAQTPQRPLANLPATGDGLIAVLCGIEKPGNVGAILRSADGGGVSAVIVADGGTDLFNPNCIRASLGTIFTQPIATASTNETLAWLRERGYRIFAARLDATQDYTTVDYRSRAAIVLGGEAAGLPAAWHADDIIPIKLPMQGTADSLNVSATAAVLFYEALRQRAPGNRMASWSD